MGEDPQAQEAVDVGVDDVLLRGGDKAGDVVRRPAAGGEEGGAHGVHDVDDVVAAQGAGEAGGATGSPGVDRDGVAQLGDAIVAPGLALGLALGS